MLRPVKTHMKTHAAISIQVTPWVTTYQGTAISANIGVNVRNTALLQMTGRYGFRAPVFWFSTVMDCSLQS